MKLSEMRTKEATDAMMELLPEIETIMSDEEFLEILDNRKVTNSKDNLQIAIVGGVTAMKLGTYLLKKHKEPTWRILSIIGQKPVEEIESQLFPVTLKQIVEIIRDKELLSFFSQPTKSEQPRQSDI